MEATASAAGEVHRRWQRLFQPAVLARIRRNVSIFQGDLAFQQHAELQRLAA